MLGVFLAPDGKNKAQVEKMTTKAISAGEKIKFSNLECNSAWTALQSMTMKSLQYPLPALMLSSTECTKIMWSLLQRVLPILYVVLIVEFLDVSFMDLLADKALA